MDRDSNPNNRRFTTEALVRRQEYPRRVTLLTVSPYHFQGLALSSGDRSEVIGLIGCLPLSYPPIVKLLCYNYTEGSPKVNPHDDETYIFLAAGATRF